jgi:hypothetical protein
MGTTLAFVGAYNLAAALLSHPSDPMASFTQYESKMKPVVTRAQKLFPGAPHSMWPETARGIWTLHFILWAVKASGIAQILFAVVWLVHWCGLGRVFGRIGGPPAAEVKVEEHGFRTLPEWDGVEG